MGCELPPHPICGHDFTDAIKVLLRSLLPWHRPALSDDMRGDPCTSRSLEGFHQIAYLWHHGFTHRSPESTHGGLSHTLKRTHIGLNPSLPIIYIVVLHSQWPKLSEEGAGRYTGGSRADTQCQIDSSLLARCRLDSSLPSVSGLRSNQNLAAHPCRNADALSSIS